jgi:hypothetical protein
MAFVNLLYHLRTLQFLPLDWTHTLLISIVANFRLICTWSNLAAVSVRTSEAFKIVILLEMIKTIT